MQTHIYKIERLTLGAEQGYRTSRYFIRPQSRRRAWKFFELHEVPEFEGPVAWFEIERTKGEWRFVRQVERS